MSTPIFVAFPPFLAPEAPRTLDGPPGRGETAPHRLPDLTGPVATSKKGASVGVLVQKYGGTSVDGPERLAAVARRVADNRRAGHQMIVVVSAMGRTTDEMFQLASAVHPDPPQRELDMLVTAGERIAMSLLAMAIHREGCEAISFTGSQSGIITDDAHGNARIRDVRAFRIRDELDRGRIVIVAGYQGVSEAKEITTLGRGGSDVTAVALAAAFGPARCELCKDVDGVLTIDPRYGDGGERVPELPLEAMLALARAGSSVLHDIAVEYALAHDQPFTVRSSLHDGPGTHVAARPVHPDRVYGTAVNARPDGTYEVALVAGPERTGTLAATSPLGEAVAVERRDALTLVWTCPTREAVSRALVALRPLLGTGA